MIGSGSRAKTSMDPHLLITASIEGNLSMVKEILRSGIDVHVYGDSAFIWSVVNGRMDVVMYLLLKGANPTVMGNLPLTMAVLYKRIDIIELILDIVDDIQSLAEVPPEVQGRAKWLEEVRLSLICGENTHLSKLVATYI